MANNKTIWVENAGTFKVGLTGNFAEADLITTLDDFVAEGDNTLEGLVIDLILALDAKFYVIPTYENQANYHFSFGTMVTGRKANGPVKYLSEIVRDGDFNNVEPNIIKFRYRKSNGETSLRNVAVQGEDDTYLWGLDKDDCNSFKKFIKRNISFKL
jgi:hypothetical protein